VSRPRVAYVAHSVDPRRGGMELVSARLLERLAEHVELEVVAGDGLETLPAGVRRTHVWLPSHPSIARLLAFDAIGSIRLAGVRRRADLVHTCGAVAHVRADLVSVHLSHAAVIEAQGGARPPGRRGAAGAAAGVRRRLAARLESWAMRPSRARCVAAVSRADAAELSERYPALRVEVVENGVDLERFGNERRAPRPAAVPLRVVVVAGDFERKRVALAIRAVARTTRCTLRVVGAGDLGTMRRLAASLGAAGRIQLVGHVPDVAAELFDADVVLSCSAHESFGLALVEGAAAGCAIVCTPTGVGPELVGAESPGEGGASGGAVVGADVEEIAGVLEALDADPAACHEQGRAAARRASRFTWDHMAASTLRLYDELLGVRS